MLVFVGVDDQMARHTSRRLPAGAVARLVGGRALFRLWLTAIASHESEAVVMRLLPRARAAAGDALSSPRPGALFKMLERSAEDGGVG